MAPRSQSPPLCSVLAGSRLPSAISVEASPLAPVVVLGGTSITGSPPPLRSVLAGGWFPWAVDSWSLWALVTAAYDFFPASAVELVPLVVPAPLKSGTAQYGASKGHQFPVKCLLGSLSNTATSWRYSRPSMQMVAAAIGYRWDPLVLCINTVLSNSATSGINLQ